MLKTRKRKMLLLPTMFFVVMFAVVALTYSAIAASHSAKAKAEITNVTVNNGEITVHFNMLNYDADKISAEFTIAKWVNNRVGWINMLQRNRIHQEGSTEVIRGGNLREEVTKGKDGFSYTFKHKDAAIDFRNGAYWTHSKPAAEGEYGAYVDHILSEIELHGKWDADAVYRIGVTSRQDERFTALAYITGTGTAVAAANAPKQNITLASCSSCHDGGKFKAHSSRRNDPQLCLTCHNNFTYDSNNSTAEVGGWANIDLMTMIHSIHGGVDGYKVEEDNFSNVPNIIENCTLCHKGEVPVPVRTY